MVSGDRSPDKPARLYECRRAAVPPTGLEGSPTGEYYVGLDLHSRASVFEIEDADGRTSGEGEVSTRLEPTRAEAAALAPGPRGRGEGAEGREHPELSDLRACGVSS